MIALLAVAVAAVLATSLPLILLGWLLNRDGAE